MGESFQPISSIGSNGAIIHYAPSSKNSSLLNREQLYLIDSGGHYLDGTTDITRTYHFGGGKGPTIEQKRAYTRVLLGNLDVERLIWPKSKGYSGHDFDILARRRLFEADMDYLHGTGHGVGSFLGVHEGPIRIARGNCKELVKGHCVSNEPGYYKEGEYGIRIENVLLVNQHKKLKQRLYFENLTYLPYSKNLIDVSLLTDNDIKFINKYHAKCLNLLSPYLNDD